MTSDSCSFVKMGHWVYCNSEGQWVDLKKKKGGYLILLIFFHG